MTDDDDPENTPRTYSGHHSSPYRVHDPALADALQRVERLEERDAARELVVASLVSSRRFWLWMAGLGIPALLSAMFVFVLYSADKISASAENVGETRAEIRALSKMIDLLESQISELRRHAGLDGKPLSITLGEP